MKYAGLSHCFRTEAGAHGRESSGLYRVHQFTKVEMFAFTRPEDSDAMHAHLLALEERIFQGLEIPYRVVDIAAADLGAPAYRKFDLEAWMPGRGEGGAFGEVTCDLELHRLPGAPPPHPLQAQGRASAPSSSTC